MAPFDMYPCDPDPIIRVSAPALPGVQAKPEPTLERMRTFVHVANSGSLSAAARELRIGQSSVTRHVRELEEAIGVSLFSRTTRGIKITEEGVNYHLKCTEILRLVEHAGEEARAGRGAEAGRIRISCTFGLGTMHLSHLLFDFQDRHREIGIDLILKDEDVNIVQEGVDIALRFGSLADSSLKLRPIGHVRRLLAASSSYLRTRGRPDSPAALCRHEMIGMFHNSGNAFMLTDAEGRKHSLPVSSRLDVPHGCVSREAILAGRGIAACHEWLIHDLLVAGVVEPVLTDYALPAIPLNMLVVPERAQITRVRLLVEFLAERMQKVPGVSRL